MNIYGLHTNPDILDHAGERFTHMRLIYYAFSDIIKQMDAWYDSDSRGVSYDEWRQDIVDNIDPRFITGIAHHSSVAIRFTSNFLKKKFPELEVTLLKEKDPKNMYLYAKASGERWPEAEKYIKQDKYAWEDYKNAVM